MGQDLKAHPVLTLLTMLIVDSREPPEIAALFDGCTRGKLEAGDLLDVSSGALVERKTPLDLLASLADGRLYDQCARIAELSPAPALIVHGSLLPNRKMRCVADGQHTQWSYWAVQMALASVQSGGVVVLLVPRQYYAEAALAYFAWAGKSKHRKVRGKWERAEPALEILAILTGSMTRAEALHRCYGSLASAMGNLEHWCEVKGIGEATVQRAARIWHNRS